MGIAALVSAFAVMTPAAGAATTSAPGAPTGLTATAGYSQVTLSWTAPTTGGAVEGYNIYMGTTGAGSEASQPINGAVLITGTTAVVPTPLNGTTYYFTVKAVNAAGMSPASNEASATPAATAPSAPTSVTATMGWTSADVCWTVPADNDGTAIQDFTITPSSGTAIVLPAAANGLSTIAGATDCYLVTGLTNGTAYTFTVSATNPIGTGAASTASNSVTPGLSVPAPPTISIAASTVYAQTDVISITVPATTDLMADGGSDILGYNIYEGTTPGGESATPINGATLECLNFQAANPAGGTCTVDVGPIPAGTAEFFVAKAVNAQGTSAPSNEVEAVTSANNAPGAPTGVTAVAGDTSVTVSFTAPASTGGPTGTTISSYTASCTETAAPGDTFSTTGTSSPITVSGFSDTETDPTGAVIGTNVPLPSGVSYTCTVTATNSVGGTSAPSVASNIVTTGATAPSTPLDLNLVRNTSGTSFTFTLSWYEYSWNGNTTNPGFQIFENGAEVGYVGPGNPANNCGPAPTGTDTEYCTVTPAATDTTEYTFTTPVLSSSTSYSFYVVAVNALGNSASSATVTGTPSDATPSAPTNLVATTTGTMANGVAAPAGDITLTWNQSSYQGDGVTGYEIFESTTPGGEDYTGAPLTTFEGGPTGPGAINCGSPANANDLTGDTFGPCTATLTGPTATTAFVPGQTYYFTVIAIGSTTGLPAGTTNNSAPSNEASVAYITAPGAVTSVTITPGNGQLAVAWDGPTSNGGSPITGYNLFIAQETATGGCPATFPLGFQVATGVTTGSYTFTGLTNGVAYCVGIQAVNAAGPGPLSTFTTAGLVNTTPGPTAPGSPTGLTAKANDDGTVALSWTPPTNTGGSAIVGYNVYYTATIPPLATATTASFTQANGLVFEVNPSAIVDGLAPGTTYYFAVTAVNTGSAGFQEGPISNIAQATAHQGIGVPGAPTAVSATAKPGQATIVWTTPVNNGGAALTGYIVEAFRNGHIQGSVRVGKVDGVTIKGLTEGASYYFKVAATNAIGTGAYSGPSNVVSVPKFAAKITFGVSTHSVTYGKEHVEHLTVHVTGAGGTASGKVSIMGAKACHITLKGGKGGCYLSAKQLAVGSHSLQAYYQGNAKYSTARSGVDRVVVHAAKKHKK